jgi:predicted aspartyl protease
MGADGSGLVDVPMSIEGHEVKMLVDTGGIFSMVTARTADDIGLQRHATNLTGSDATPIAYYGGAIVKEYVDANSIKLGNLSADRMTLFIIPDSNIDSSKFGGTLASDVLRKYDVDFDFGKSKLNLFSPDHCDGQVVYWTQTPYAKVPIKLNSDGHIDVEIQLDGKVISARLDTGAGRTFMSLEYAEAAFGIDGKDSQLKPIEGSGKKGESPAYTYPFRSFALGDIQVLNPNIILVSDEYSKRREINSPPIILGIGMLRQLHLYIAYRERNLYATGASAR